MNDPLGLQDYCSIPLSLAVNIREVRNLGQNTLLGLLRCIQDFPDGVMEAAQIQLHGAHALVRVSGHPQDVSVVEQMKFLLDKRHTIPCAYVIIEEFPKHG